MPQQPVAGLVVAVMTDRSQIGAQAAHALALTVSHLVQNGCIIVIPE